MLSDAEPLQSNGGQCIHRLVNFHTITAISLGSIQRQIRALVKTGGRITGVAEARTQAGGHDLGGVFKVLNRQFVADLSADAFAGTGQVGAIRVAQHQGELLTTQTPDHILDPQVRAQHVRETKQRRVARVMGSGGVPA